jgi:hypothetical protein
MRVPSAEALLAAWERGLAHPPASRPLILLTAADGDSVLEPLAELPVGDRNYRLLRLREWLFGPELCGVVDCSACGNEVETRFPVAPIESSSTVPAKSLGLRTGGYVFRFRLPSARDLLEMPPGEVTESRRWLLERCVETVTRRGKAVASSSLPEEVVAALGRRMAELDRLAIIELALDCPFCRHRSDVYLEIGSFLWGEVDCWARRLLRDVHRLAAAYAWSEADILRLSPRRRQAYLEMLPA